MRRLALVLLTLAACGGGSSSPDAAPPGPDAPPDGPPVANLCGATAAHIATYPGTYTGATVGAGADLAAAMDACADQRGYYGDVGEDQVVQLDGLTAGQTYVITLTTDDDLGFYVTSACDAAGPTSGACLLHVDNEFTTELGEFVAPTGGSVAVVIDSANDPAPPPTGAYTLAVRAAECTDTIACTDASKPVCQLFTCVECATSFDCHDAAKATCDRATSTCVDGFAQCTGDDAGEQDDGPAAAHAIAMPTAGTPTVVTGHAVCRVPSDEDDYYRFTVTTPTEVRFALDWSVAGADLDMILKDPAGNDVDGGIASGAGPEVFFQQLAAGDYFLEVYQHSPATAPATPYTLTLSLPDCTSGFDCAAGAPVCDNRQCVAGPTTCTGDDSGDSGAGDDGPVLARAITPGAVGTPTPVSGAICGVRTEADWYKVTVQPGEGLTLALGDFTSPTDLDLAVFDSTGKLYGLSFWVAPEVVTLTYLPAGVYYARVSRVDSAAVAATTYTLTATRTTAQTCTSASDCATTYDTQLYRGACVSGACQFIPTGTAAANAACDSDDDCASGRCSYLPFESDAAKSVCSKTCTANTDCVAGQTCTTGLAVNRCVPQCTDAFQCGANTRSGTIEPGRPWDYLTCTAGVCGL